MSLILRNVKGSPLTYNEMDDNLTYLEGLATSSGAQDLASVLTNGNETGGNNIVLSDGDVINAENGGGQLNLRYSGNNTVFLSNDSGGYANQGLMLQPGYVGLFDYSANGLVEITAPLIGLYTNTSGRRSYLVLNQNGFSYMGQKGSGVSGADTNFTFVSVDNTSNKTTSNLDVPPGLVSSRNSTINSGIVNSVILGGNGITATASNTVYVPDLVIGGTNVKLSGIPTYANNADAITGGLTTDSVYKTASGELRIVV